ncbi:MAG: DUF983 domain-containing protein [Leadbetterella sp.]|nr:DUF983 domain-containing protein [Leadbetterella sp.]
MKKYCPECGLKYEKELGYFYGSMYVSYALNIGLFTVCLLSYLFFFKDRYGWEYFAIAYLLSTFLLTGVIFRQARALWLAALTKYEPGIKDEKKSSAARNRAQHRKISSTPEGPLPGHLSSET